MDLVRDLRHALRSLRKSPALVLVATLSLGLGIAVNVTVFAGIDFVVLRPFRFPDQERLIQVWSAHPARGWDRASVSLPDFLDWRREARAVTLAGYAGASFNLAGSDQPERVEGLAVSGDYFAMFGARPARGRLIDRSDETATDGRIVVMSHRLWRDRFDGDTAIVGSSILLDDEPYTVVGVGPERFAMPRVRAELWTPLTEMMRDGTRPNRIDRAYRVIGKLRPSTSLGEARAELVAIAGRLERAYPESNAGLTVHVLRYVDQVIDAGTRQGATIATVAVALVLLIACANVANLLLARNASRTRELAVRSAIGAGRRRIVGQLLTESLALALVGGAAGLALAFAGIGWFRSILPADLPGGDAVRVSGRSLAFALGITGLAGLVFGMAPALKAGAADLAGALREAGRTGTAGTPQGRLRNGLVVAELALALVLLISAGLLIKASLGLQRVDLGFEPANVVTFRTALSAREYGDTTRILGFHDAVLDRLGALPGVERAGAVTEIPMSSGTGTYFTIVGDPEPDGDWPVAQYRAITPGYLEAMGIELRRGRGIEPTDHRTSLPVALVNERFARARWPRGDAIGREIRLRSGLVRRIVGVVEDTRESGPDDPAPEVMYFPVAQTAPRRLSYVVRSEAAPDALVPSIRRAVAEVRPRQPIYDVVSLASHVEGEFRGEMVLARLLAVFGTVALLLAMMGVYGVMAYSVAQRTQEIGVRRALGAGGTDILRLVGGYTGRLAISGIAIGIGLAALSTRALSRYLFGVSAFDPMIFIGVPAALVAAAALASLIPARRAARVDPVVALKSE